MDTQQQCSTQDGATATKKYTRRELFRLAKLMNNSETIVEELDRLEHADWSQYNLDLMDAGDESETKFCSIKSINSFGRKNSELDHEYSSLTDHRVHSEWRRPQPIAPTMRLSRMTSSPSIRYGTNNIKSQLNAQQDGIPMQIKAKYAKLIESMSANSGDQQQTTNSTSTGSRSDLLNRDSNAPTSSWRLNELKPAERPTNLFGPLRREVLRQKGNRRNSEEPMSLPYIPDHGMRNNYSGRVLPNSGLKGLLDYNNPSPIQRFTSSDMPKKENKGDADEEDDFDITSLLNITVLSDIKTIRQDQQQYHSSNNRPTLSRQLSNRSRNEDVGGAGSPGIKPLLRARTSTDFTYQGRKLDGYEADQRRVNHGYFAEQRAKNGPESLNTYRWASTSPEQQVSAFEHREMARERQQNNEQLRENLAPVDKSIARIIETFKAQVKARAEEKLAKPLATSPRASSTSTCDLSAFQEPSSDEKLAKPLATSPRASSTSTCDLSAFQEPSSDGEIVPPNVERIIHYSNGQKEEVSTSLTALAQDTTKDADNLFKIKDNKPTAKIEPELSGEKDQTRAAVSVTTFNAAQSTVKLDDSATKKPIQTKLGSQIPRLIRLRDLNKAPASTPLSETKAVPVAKEQQQRLTTMLTARLSANATTTTTTTTTTTKKAKPRFVSQYRRLRGKSLADEMEDMPK